MKLAYTETDSTLTHSPEGKVTETVTTFQCSSMQTEEVLNTEVEDKITQTEVDDFNILTVNKIEIVYSMELWRTQTDVAELEDMLLIRPRNEPQDERETTLSTHYSHVGDTNQPNFNAQGESHTGVNAEHTEEVEVDTSVRDESDFLTRNVNMDSTESNNVNQGTMPAEAISNAVSEVGVPEAGDNDDALEVVNPEVAASLNEDEVDFNQRADDGDVCEFVTRVNPTGNPEHSETESIISSASKSEESQRSQKQLAGIDMHIGEYQEVKFPPVVSTIVPQKPIESTKERMPSLVCTMKHSEKKKFPKSIPKLPASCTVLEDPVMS